jgi:hypothetical protein
MRCKWLTLSLLLILPLILAFNFPREENYSQAAAVTQTPLVHLDPGISSFTLVPDQQVERAYCYFQVNHQPWQRFPEADNSFVDAMDTAHLENWTLKTGQKIGYGFTYQPTLGESLSLPTGTITLNANCLGWQENQLVELGTLSQTFNSTTIKGLVPIKGSHLTLYFDPGLVPAQSAQQETATVTPVQLSPSLKKLTPVSLQNGPLYQKPDLALISMDIMGTVSISKGGQVHVRLTVKNKGTAEYKGQLTLYWWGNEDWWTTGATRKFVLNNQVIPPQGLLDKEFDYYYPPVGYGTISMGQISAPDGDSDQNDNYIYLMVPVVFP